MNSTIDLQNHLVTHNIQELCQGLFRSNYAWLKRLGLTERPEQGAILINTGEQFVILIISDDEIFQEVVVDKRDITHQAGVSTSGEARNIGVRVGAHQFIFKGYFEENGLGIGYSGAEEDLDEFYARTLHAFVFAIISMFMKVIINAPSIKKLGDPLASDDVIGHCLLARLPDGVQELFPNEVQQPLQWVEDAMVMAEEN